MIQTEMETTKAPESYFVSGLNIDPYSYKKGTIHIIKADKSGGLYGIAYTPSNKEISLIEGSHNGSRSLDETVRNLYSRSWNLEPVQYDDPLLSESLNTLCKSAKMQGQVKEKILENNANVYGFDTKVEELVSYTQMLLKGEEPNRVKIRDAIDSLNSLIKIYGLNDVVLIRRGTA